MGFVLLFFSGFAMIFCSFCFGLTQTLAALKRAYADTILNTTKEAAARVMVSEKKARRYQQELVTVRNEALHTLVRLKQMLDSKVLSLCSYFHLFMGSWFVLFGFCLIMFLGS